MAVNTYLAQLQVGNNTAVLGNALSGYCNTYSRTAEKEVILNGFDDIEPGIQIAVRFLNGARQTSGATLKVGSSSAVAVQGPCICSANEVLAFVYEQTGATIYDGVWRTIGHYVLPSDDTPTPVGTASAGTSANYARADHTHNLDMTQIAELVNGNFVSKDIIKDPFDMFYAQDSDTIVRLAANDTTTKKFLRSMGISQTIEEDGETVTKVVTTAPVWEAITAADIGLGNVTNHKQVTDVTFNNATGAVIVTKGDEAPVTLFTLGANAFLSTAYLPLTGGKLLGQLSFSRDANIIVWENLNKSQRLIVTPSVSSEDAVFTFQQEQGAAWTTLFTIRGNSSVSATTFIGALTGNASTASALRHESLNNTSIDDTDGSFAFSGTGTPWANKNWVGLQIGDSHLRFQLVNNTDNMVIRTYDGSTWSVWDTLLTESMIHSGDSNGQIKVGDTNINVTGLGALAFEDRLPSSGLPDMSDVYVTLSTDQTITGIKTFTNVMFAAPAVNEKHGLLFQGTTDSAAIKYFEASAAGHLRISMAASDDTPIEFAWKPTRAAGQELVDEQVVHQFTSTEYIFNPLQERNNTYNPIAIRPGITESGSLGTLNYKWAQVHAVEVYAALKGNADTATSAVSDINGLRIDTNYLKLDGGTMRGVIYTRSPINQVIDNGEYIDAFDAGAAASPNRYKPLLWNFNTSITPTTGDIITIRVPSNGHTNGIYLSMDNGLNYYPITLNGTDALTDQYPIGSCLTLIFDGGNVASNIYALTGSDLKQTISNGTWRVLNYYDSGAPYGIRVYKSSTDLNHEYPILMSQLMFNDITGTPYTDNVYALLNSDSTKVPTINPYTGVITAAAFHGPMDGTATSAIEFSSPTTVTLTGNVTGVSTPSTRGWSVETTIAEGTVTNEMLYGGISRNKLEVGVVKVYNYSETSDLLNINSFPINGFFTLRSYENMIGSTGDRPFNGEGVFFNLLTPDSRGFMQLAGQEDRWLIRGISSTENNISTVDWRNLVLEDIAGQNNRAWSISITGAANSAVRDGNGNIITEHYATNTRVSELLGEADALVFKGLIDSSQQYDDAGRKVYRNLPTSGYSAGWVYKANNDDTYAGQVCEIGDLIIAVNNGPVSGNTVRAQDWIVVQANLETSISGMGSLVTPKSFAIFDSASGKYIRDTKTYMVSLDHTDALAGINRVGWLDGFQISGITYENAADLIGNVANEMSFGDSGPQIQFVDDDTAGAIIFNRHEDNSGLATTFHFVTDGGRVAVKADGFVARQKIAIGSKNVDATAALKVTGISDFQGNLIIRDSAAQHLLQIEFVDDKCVFRTQDQIAFGNNVFVGGNIYPTTTNYYTLGLNDPNQPLTWHAVYIGSSLSYGSNNQPIYWNEGIPTPITYTPNRLYYAPTAESGASFDTGAAYMPGNHYIDSTKLAINYSAGAPNETLYVNGNARIDGTLASNSDILPSTNNASSLGTYDTHWSALFVGPNNSYGDGYTPIYWNNGTPEIVNIIQKASFSFDSSTLTYNINKAAYTLNTIVLQIVITSGKENLTSAINWEPGNSNIQLKMATAPRGPVSGYILTARGVDLDQGV